LLDGLDIERACFLGHSDGGSIAIILAANHPERMTKMILVAAHIYVEPKMEGGLRSIEAAAAVPPFSTTLKREHRDRAQDLVKAWLSCWLGHGFITLDLREELCKVQCPTLVIQGEEDEHATIQHARNIAAGIKGSALWLIPGVGHMPMHEIPGAFNQRILAFLRNDGSPEGGDV
jgi:pimeloyl-ACP methyl ester carboxylesterase